MEAKHYRLARLHVVRYDTPLSCPVPVTQREPSLQPDEARVICCEFGVTVPIDLVTAQQQVFVTVPDFLVFKYLFYFYFIFYKTTVTDSPDAF